MRFLRRVGEGRTNGCHVSAFAAVETESFLGTLFLFFWGEFLGKSDCVNIHGIGVFDGPGVGEGLESLGRPFTSLGDLFSMIPLVLEVGGF